VKSLPAIHDEIDERKNLKLTVAGFRADPLAGAVGPGFRHCRRYAKPPAATLLTGLAGGERLSQFLLQLVCPSYFGCFCPKAQELSSRELRDCKPYWPGSLTSHSDQQG
jgi:hypothetical protein